MLVADSTAAVTPNGVAGFGPPGVVVLAGEEKSLVPMLFFAVT